MYDLLSAYKDFTWENFSLIGKELSRIDRDNLNGALLEHPVIFQQYMSLLALSKKELDEANGKLNLISYRLRKECRETNLHKKLTAKDLDALIGTDEEFLEAERTVNEESLKYLTVKGMVSALEHKKDVLVQLSANSRTETKLYS